MRTVEVYPKAHIDGDEWMLKVKVGSSTFTHIVPAGLTASTPVLLLKVGITLEIGDSDTDQDVDDALYVDDITVAPGVETVWGNWQAAAEALLVGMSEPYTAQEFNAAQNPSFTNQMRNDGRTAFETGRGWTVTRVHQHEGDGTNLDWTP